MSHPAPSPLARGLERRIIAAGKRGVPVLTSVDDCRAIEELKAHRVVRWTGTRWIHRVHEDKRPAV